MALELRAPSPQARQRLPAFGCGAAHKRNSTLLDRARQLQALLGGTLGERSNSVRVNFNLVAIAKPPRGPKMERANELSRAAGLPAGRWPETAAGRGSGPNGYRD
jgi:hypothetical protein